MDSYDYANGNEMAMDESVEHSGEYYIDTNGDYVQSTDWQQESTEYVQEHPSKYVEESFSEEQSSSSDEPDDENDDDYLGNNREERIKEKKLLAARRASAPMPSTAVKAITSPSLYQPPAAVAPPPPPQQEHYDYAAEETQHLMDSGYAEMESNDAEEVDREGSFGSMEQEAFLKSEEQMHEEFMNSDNAARGAAAYDLCMGHVYKTELELARRHRSKQRPAEFWKAKIYVMYMLRCIYDNKFRIESSSSTKFVKDHLAPYGFKQHGSNHLVWSLIKRYWPITRLDFMQVASVFPEKHPHSEKSRRELRLPSNPIELALVEENLINKWEENYKASDEAMEKMTCKDWFEKSHLLMERLSWLFCKLMELKGNNAVLRQRSFRTLDLLALCSVGQVLKTPSTARNTPYEVIHKVVWKNRIQALEKAWIREYKNPKEYPEISGQQSVAAVDPNRRSSLPAIGTQPPQQIVTSTLPVLQNAKLGRPPKSVLTTVAHPVKTATITTAVPRTMIPAAMAPPAQEEEDHSALSARKRLALRLAARAQAKMTPKLTENDLLPDKVKRIIDRTRREVSQGMSIALSMADLETMFVAAERMDNAIRLYLGEGQNGNVGSVVGVGVRNGVDGLGVGVGGSGQGSASANGFGSFGFK
ncbi:hypothetical protein HDU76_005228 [Blyttiomyces sp. JEL0837]|nr:hypothetical protein HDU76_005228 [Blyttiomyces sp. JEL0837]